MPLQNPDASPLRPGGGVGGSGVPPLGVLASRRHLDAMALRREPSEVVVIGAGAAGIAAARELRRLGRRVLVLEARDRIGGRAHTVPLGPHAPLDLGCEWLHSADCNILAETAASLGFTLDRSDPPWRRPSYSAAPGTGDAEASREAYGAFDERLARAAEAAERSGRDRPAADLLEPGGRWNGFIGAISTYYNGAPPERVSVVDYGRYRDTEHDWRVEGGYGGLVAALGAGLAIRLGCAVTAVDATGLRLRIATDQGTIEADQLVVTVPASVLASGAIRFAPAFDDHLAAAAGLPLGVADKLYLALEGAKDFPPDTRLRTSGARTDTGSYTLRPRGRPIVEGYFGGDYARALEAGGVEAFAAAALEEIAEALGTGFRRRLTPILATAWARDPLSLGSYSHALPGRADARAVLATPVDGRIVFAGEATSPHFFSTAHGAFETGLAAARTLSVN